MQRADAELPQRAQESHLLRANLSGAQEGDALRPVLVHERAELERENLQRFVPIGWFERAGLRIAQQRRRRTVGRGERCERFPAFRAGHAEIHRIILRRGKIYCVAVLEMDVQPAASRAKAADHRGRRVRLEPRGHVAEAEVGRMLHEVRGEGAGALAQHGTFLTRGTRQAQRF